MIDELLEATTPSSKRRRRSPPEEEREDTMKSVGMLLTIVAMTSGIVAFYYTDKISEKDEMRKELTSIVRDQEEEHKRLYGKINELSEVSYQIQNAVKRIETVQDKIEERFKSSQGASKNGR